MLLVEARASRMSHNPGDPRRESLNASVIESKINQIFQEAKKRNPEGYTLKNLKHFDSASSCDSSSNLASPSSSSTTINTTDTSISRSSSTSSSSSASYSNTNAQLNTTTSQGSYYSNAQYPRYQYYHGADLEREEKETSSYTKKNKFINPVSGQEICILVTTVNIPLTLQPIE